MGNELKSIKNRVFFVGVGGISMSALAMLCYKNGCVVAGSDASKNAETIKLAEYFKVYYTHKETNISVFKPNLVVYSGAIKLNNPELNYAQNNGIKLMERSEFLGEICNNFNNVIAIAGTHGKTTTTAMIAEIFIKAGLNPTVHVGGNVVNLKGNLVVGNSNFFITEACEYKNSFKYISSDTCVVTNIESDHMDCYSSFSELENAFINFINKAKCCVINCGNKATKKVKTKGLLLLNSALGFEVKNIKKCGIGYSFVVYENGLYLGTFKLNIMGKYNIQNALNAIAVAKHYGISTNIIYNALLSFNGVERRNEKLGGINSTPVFADYCHHPTEIASSINAFREHYKNILCVFQPHTYSRTKVLKTEFSTCFKGVKKLVLFKTYAARELPTDGLSETDMFKFVKNRNKELVLTGANLLNIITQESANFDAVIVLGAGDIYNIVKNGLTFN